MRSVYIHVPFCARRCDYCDFATWTDRHHLTDAYVDACITQIRAEVREPVNSVFFGGGTPTLVPAGRIVEMLDAIPLAPGAEVTVETNPETIDAASAIELAEAGVTRMSVGMQSGVPHVLESLGRRHDPATVALAVAAIRDAGIAHCNVDLIYGADRESLADWEISLNAALALPIDHISAYALTIEPGTPLATLVSAGERAEADDDAQADKYLLAEDRLSAAGFQNYEISNWAKPGGTCAHNLGYWQGGTVIPIGCAAHGYDGTRRMWTVRTPDRFIECIRDNRSPIAGEEVLTDHQRARERLMLELRTGAGTQVPATETLDTLVYDGLLVPVRGAPGTYQLTVRGKLLANAVTIELLDAFDRAANESGDLAGENLTLRPVSS